MKDPMFRGQYRPAGSGHWTTHCEEPRSADAYDAILTADLPRGAEVRVVPVGREPVAEPRGVEPCRR